MKTPSMKIISTGWQTDLKIGQGARYEDVDETFETYFGPRKTIMYKARDVSMTFALSKRNQEHIRKNLNRYA